MLSHLVSLNCSEDQLSSLNVSGLVNLKTLNCSSNAITHLSVNDLTALETLDCSSNSIANLNISGLPNLKSLIAQGLSYGASAPKTLTLSNLPALLSVTCNASALNELNMSGLDNLATLDCRLNKFTVLDASMLYNIVKIEAQNNYNLEYLFIKNGKSEDIQFGNNLFVNVMKYICADEGQLNAIQSAIASNGYTFCHTSSYCSFTPGGINYNTITGTNTYDINNNGCDSTDGSYPNFKLNLSKINESSIYIADASGNYSYYPQNGSYTLTPIIEHPEYFNVTPASVNINFPAQISPLTQNFCVSPNGIRNDLEVVIFGLTGARPGFDAQYKIVYQNKGNQLQSGTVNLSFNDAILDFVSAFPASNGQTSGNHTWNFANLKPFETREIILTFNLNSPVETPPVNSDYVLNYTTSIGSSSTDETPANNVFNLNQIVVNSMDPNDKTCLEGTSITLQMVGKEVHYLIRFENTGTANAQNVIVRDMIDTAKFDVNSLVPINGSHPFVTRINTNKVEFIFEDIDLPFDDENNDGYVAFKIKTKPNLVLGNTFSNTASIYFDYNFPIITNNYTTTVAALSVQDFEFENYFILSPNPAKDRLDISNSENIEVSSISVYNVLGQLVLVKPNAQETKYIDVSNLSVGNYFLKITSEKGSATGRFIKK